MASILADFAAAVLRHPQRTAIVDGKGHQTSFADLKARADGFARGWAAKGIGPGDRVLLAMTLNADLYASLAALWSLGATVVLPEPAMGIAGLRHAAKVTRPRAFCSSGAYGLLKYALPELWPLCHLRPSKVPGHGRDVPAPKDTDIALISFTSGTTGAPKAIPRSHGFLAAQHQAIAPLLHSATPQRDLVAFPVFVLINIASGQTSVLPSWRMSRLARLDPARLSDWIATQNVTRALIPPALCAKLAKTQVPPGLHTVFTGGGPVFPDMLAKLGQARPGQARPGLTMVCVYGSTEAEPIAHIAAQDITAQDLAQMTEGQGLLVGRPVPGLKLRIAGVEIQVAGAHVNAGYLNPIHDADNKIHDAGTIWHRTGDAGHLDDQGRLWVVGRTGSQVALPQGRTFPFQIEVAAHGWDGVTQCALIATAAGPCLVIEGDASHLPTWQIRARDIGIATVRPVSRMPMDRRHASKIDRAALLRQMGL